MKSAPLAKLGLATAALLVGAASCVGCAGLSKSELETRLAGLAKNAPLAALGVERSSATADAEYAYIRIPARAGEDAPPIVFVHGTPSTLYNWSALLYEAADEPSLVGEGDIYLLEVAGHGIANSNLRAETFQDCADHVRGFLAALDLRGVTLVGHSYGGEFAWRAALDAPDRVARLVLMDSSGYRRPDDAWLPEEHKLREWPGAGFGYLLNSRERLRPALQLHFEAAISADQLEEMYLCCDNASNWQAMTELCRDENGTREVEIQRIAQPTLLVWGERDIAYPVETVARRFERDIRGSRLAVIEGAGHYPHEERIGAVRRALREFLRGAR
ncbi:MAG: alpha/beta hydrolase [Planctomycetes bacterium]|nr:alpha/beta hydrolase [Planctomycetota bacterium]